MKSIGRVAGLAACLALGLALLPRPEPDAPTSAGARHRANEHPLDRLALPIAESPAGPECFALRDRNVSAFFSPRGIAYSFVSPASRAPAAREDAGRAAGWGLHWGLVGARETPPQPEGMLPGRVHHLVGGASQRPTDLPTYSGMVYREVRPGVDLRIESRAHGLEYVLHAAPGADLGTLRLRYEGASEVRLVDDGKAIEAVTALGTLREDGLFCYQEVAGRRIAVQASYALVGGNEYAIALGPYDPALALVIDPTITWASFLGGTGDEEGFSIAVDSFGNRYVTGYTNSADFPTTVGAFDTALGGTLDAFVTKVNPLGSAIIWSSYLGGSLLDTGYGIAVDSQEYVYVVGETSSADFPTTNGFDTALGGPRDAFVTKLNPSGSTIVWSSYFGGSADEQGFGIALDVGLNVHITGTTTSGNMPTPATFDGSLGGGRDAFYAELNWSGAAVQSASYLGGDLGQEYGYAIAVDGGGHAYITGYTTAIDFPTAGGPFDPSYNGGGDAFVTKVDALGTVLTYSSYLGGSSQDIGYGIAVDTVRNAYVTGQTASANFPISAAYQSTFGGVIDAFVTRVNETGTALDWSSYLGGTADDYGYAVAVDSDGNAYVTGQTFSADFPVTAPPAGFDTTLAGLSDAFVARLNTLGTILAWSSYLGGSGNDGGFGIAVDTVGVVHVTGGTTSADFPTTLGAFDTTLGGLTDAFVARIGPPDTLAPTVGITNPTSAPTFVTSTTPIQIDGLASDNNYLNSVTWSNAATGASGPTNGLTLWTITIALIEGPNLITVTAVDSSGNSATATITVTLDTMQPAAPVITSPTTGSTLNVSVVTLTGTAEAGSTVFILDGATPFGSTPADAAGAWTFTTAPLAPGPHTFTARAMDAAGNLSAASAPVTVTLVDITPPVMTITLPTSAPTYSTSSPTVGLVGTTTDDFGVASVTWSNADTGGSGAASGTTPWNATIPLQLGPNAITVTSTDTSGNTATATITVTYTPLPPKTKNDGFCGSVGVDALFPLGFLWLYRRVRRRPASGIPREPGGAAP